MLAPEHGGLVAHVLVLLDLVLAQQQRHGHLADGVAAGAQQVGALLGTERRCYTLFRTMLCTG